jgi:protocatechuate 3,4-dioxygenase beta subunit
MTPTALVRSVLTGLAAAAAIGPFTVALPGVADAATNTSTWTAGAGVAAGQQGWVTGTVVDRHGDPLDGVLVNALKPVEVPEAGPLSTPSARQDLTDASGTFRVRQAAGPFLVQICTPEPGAPVTCKEAVRGVRFMPTYVGPAGVTDSWVTQTSLFTSTAGDRDLGSVTVKPQAFVSGQLSGASFLPVQVQRLNGTAAWHGETDGDGAYAFRGLAPGRYRIAAGGPGTGFLPFSSDIVELSAREHETVDGTLDRGARIRGVVTAHGSPAAGLDVLVSRNGETVAAATTDLRGRYRVDGLAPGSYTHRNCAVATPYRRTPV